MNETSFHAYQAKAPDTPAERVTLGVDDLTGGDLLVKVVYSSLNYKDGLAMTGYPGVVMTYPLTCGIDLAGEVVTAAGGFQAGEQIVLTGANLSQTKPGGYSQYQRVDPEFVVRAPKRLGTWGAMAVGTGGLTAMFCVMRLQKAGITPDSGPVLVTGASGGVGSYAVSILSRLGYRVEAVAGTSGKEEYLADLGADTVYDRDELAGEVAPLGDERWAGAVDCVGGSPLAKVLSQISYAGSVAACGLAGGQDLPSSVMPFIIRNVTLYGVDSVFAPAEERAEAWSRLDELFTPEEQRAVAHDEPFDKLPQLAQEILDGKIRGRVVIDVAG
ncbi:MDR family oxidoreductase [Microbacterium sp.]|uniref:MDR family oxidoreductase n=1 Tax=Microbacterium sp. TaxID=51671 RepID=UPI003A88A264